jgi:dinuclear metal center YbgI/SA1388 family protein
MKLDTIIAALEKWAPLSLQEDYDNSGLLLGDKTTEISGALVSLDLSLDVLHEALSKNCNLVISHHPFIFRGVKKLTVDQPEYALVRESILHNINIYSIHTNLDNLYEGINKHLCEKLGLVNCKILKPAPDLLFKLAVFVPHDYADKVRNALFTAGAGNIGNYDACSFNVKGEGTFRASELAAPFVGKINETHSEPETRIEVIFPGFLRKGIISALRHEHPYEEIAYDIYPLGNEFEKAGAGMVGEFPEPMDEQDFLSLVKEQFGLPVLRHTMLTGSKVKKVAVCSGSGAFLVGDAIRSGAGAFLTGDLKYHDFTEAGTRILLADIGHYESEQCVKELISGVLIEKFPNFAVFNSEKEKNPVKYY